jgi:hypothetical protein
MELILDGRSSIHFSFPASSDFSSNEDLLGGRHIYALVLQVGHEPLDAD